MLGPMYIKKKSEMHAMNCFVFLYHLYKTFLSITVKYTFVLLNPINSCVICASSFFGHIRNGKKGKRHIHMAKNVAYRDETGWGKA